MAGLTERTGSRPTLTEEIFERHRGQRKPVALSECCEAPRRVGYGGVVCLTHGLAATFFATYFAYASSEADNQAKKRDQGVARGRGRPPHHAQGGAFLENGRGAGNLARSRLSGGSWAMSEPSWPAEGRLKAGCSQDWLPHKAAHICIIR